MKLIPQSSRASTEPSEEGIDENFAGDVFCSCASTKIGEWILDTGATNHMTPVCKNLVQPQSCIDIYINLPDGSLAPITHRELVLLANDLELKNILCAPTFKFNILSVSKLVQGNDWFVMSYPIFCVIHDLATRRLKGISKQRGGLYYLVDADLNIFDPRLVT